MITNDTNVRVKMISDVIDIGRVSSTKCKLFLAGYALWKINS